MASPVLAACITGNRPFVELLLEAGGKLVHEYPVFEPGADFSKPPARVHRASPALFAAVRRAPADFVSWLPDHCGLDLHMTDLNGETLLHKAAEEGNLPVARLLVQRGISPNTTSYHTPPLHVAARRKHTAVAEFLLQAGADAQAEGPGGNALDELLFYGGDAATEALLTAAGAKPSPRES